MHYKLAGRERHNSVSLKRFEDGHTQEAVMAGRLRLVDGIILETIDPKTGKQFEYTDLNGHLVGKIDGKVTGLLQAPKKLHIWDHKSTSLKKLNEFRKIKAELGEKQTLRKWNIGYYVQAILYMYYEGTDRHYLTVSDSGGRDEDSCRTELDVAFALQMIARGKRIINDPTPPEKISNSKDFWMCRSCTFSGICHDGDMPHRSCRLCVHSSPVENGEYHCARWGKKLTGEEQIAGCPTHLMNPAMVPGEVIEATETSITYKLHNGNVWTDSEAK